MVPKQQILHKFLHGWLPLQTQPQVTSTLEGKLCPSCKQQPKDMLHFLSCQHMLRKLAIATLQSQLQTLHHKHVMDPYLYQVLWQGLTSMILQHNLPNPHEQYPPPYIHIFEAQQRIGWVHILQGCFANAWIQAVEQQGINGTNFYAKVTQLCWQYVITSWMECNRALHDRAQPYNISQLRITVQQIFHDAAQHPDTQATVHDQTIETILACPSAALYPGGCGKLRDIPFLT